MDDRWHWTALEAIMKDGLSLHFECLKISGYIMMLG